MQIVLGDRYQDLIELRPLYVSFGTVLPVEHNTSAHTEISTVYPLPHPAAPAQTITSAPWQRRPLTDMSSPPPISGALTALRARTAQSLNVRSMPPVVGIKRPAETHLTGSDQTKKKIEVIDLCEGD